jgi:tRNA(Ile)-lysidine synthase
MSSLLPRVANACRELRLSGARVLIGVSGGADSVSLLRALHLLRQELNLCLHVAHLNHQLRAEAADEDARWVEGLCLRLSLPVSIGTANIARIAADSSRGIEEAARDARYRFLQRVARESGCRAIAVAHTADDQAETILHHIIRGTGLAGLAGIPRERELEPGLGLVRPLLEVTKAEVIEFLTETGQDFREDETNRDEVLTRNYLRRRLIPTIRQELNPNFPDALCRLGQQASEIQQSITWAAGMLLERVLEVSSSSESRLTWQAIAGCPRHLVREMLSLLWRQSNWPRQAMTFEHWDRLAAVLLEGGAADFPGGIYAIRSGRLFTIHRRPSNATTT